MSILFAATYPERVSHLILIGGFVRSGYTRSDEAFEAAVTSRIAAWGTGQSMKHVIGTRDENEREIALLGKYERLASSPGAYKTLLLMTRRIDVGRSCPACGFPRSCYIVAPTQSSRQPKVESSRRLSPAQNTLNTMIFPTPALLERGRGSSATLRNSLRDVAMMLFPKRIGSWRLFSSLTSSTRHVLRWKSEISAGANCSIIMIVSPN